MIPLNCTPEVGQNMLEQLAGVPFPVRKYEKGKTVCDLAPLFIIPDNSTLVLVFFWNQLTF